MSERDEHRDLVDVIASYTMARFPLMRVKKDILERPGDPSTPIINEYKPDVFGSEEIGERHVIGEAKTAGDLDVNHTYSQLRAFLGFLESKNEGVLILGVVGQKAVRAKSMLYFLHREMRLVRTRLLVFDGLDYWELIDARRIQWRLL